MRGEGEGTRMLMAGWRLYKGEGDVLKSVEDTIIMEYHSRNFTIKELVFR